MKIIKEKLNEDINITDPQLASKYNALQQQIVDKQKQINQINNDILTLEKNKTAIEQQASDSQAKNPQPATTTPAPAPPASPATGQTVQNTSSTPNESMNYHILSINDFINEALSNPDNIDAMNILNVDDYDDQEQEDDEDSNLESVNNYNESDDEYVFYVKVEKDNEEFIGKIYKNTPEGDWFGKVEIGENTTFDDLSYKPEFTKDDILNFLIDNYDDAEIISSEDYEAYLEGENESDNIPDYTKILDVEKD